MTEFEEKILERLGFIEEELKRLKTDKPAQAFDDLPPGAVVGKDYVAWRFGITERAVQRGENGTNKIHRVSNKPMKFIKREVDKVWAEMTKPVKQKAAEIRQNTKQRRYSIIGKQSRA